MKSIAITDPGIINDLAIDLRMKIMKAVRHTGQFVEGQALALAALQASGVIVGVAARLLTEEPAAKSDDHVDLEEVMLVGLIMGRISGFPRISDAIDEAWKDMDALKAAGRWPTGVVAFGDGP
jgi:hypothetical protein